MRIELQDFCRNFATDIKPLASALEACVTTIHSHCDETATKSLVTRLIDIQHRLKVLFDKAEQQHAYLLIFGPLKSGKSTLMNAISGAYVSEVSSLPAYPCMVYVNNAEKPTYELTSFGGETRRFETNAELQMTVRNGHEALARKIREAEKQGSLFDPARDLPDAIRRVDIGLPAPNLSDSGATLVDTPGLYSKMKFGYDLLTREFQNNAACALFVVKTDNLFLEQVFDEFRDLLGFFSRIFLVVNIDSAKKDIGPDGKLHPSLESSEPSRIIEAFEDLTMNAQLRDAIDEGRLRIYLIDLLEAATLSLHGEKFAAPEGGFAADEGKAQVGPITVTQGNKGFPVFLEDMTEYLNSSDFTTEFMHDSLRQSGILTRELESCAECDYLQKLRQGIAGLERQLKSHNDKLDALSRLDAITWQDLFSEANTALEKGFDERSGDVTKALSSRLHSHVRDWFESNESIKDLAVERLDKSIQKSTEGARRELVTLMTEQLNDQHSGAELSSEKVADLMLLELSLADIFPSYQPQLDAIELQQPEPVQIDPKAIPVRKSFWDWLQFKSRDTLRGQIFGTSDVADRPIPVKIKSKKLGSAVHDHLAARVNAYLDKHFANRWGGIIDKHLEAYAAHYAAQVARHLTRLRESVSAEKRATENQLERNRKVLSQVDGLKGQMDSFDAHAQAMHERFVAPRLKKREAARHHVRETYSEASTVDAQGDPEDTPSSLMSDDDLSDMTEVDNDPDPNAS